MKNYTYSVFVLFFIGISAFGQTENWLVEENDFQYTMSFVAFANVDGVQLSSKDDKVAAFVNGECRGVTNLTYVQSEDKYYVYLTVFSNENGETINFKVFDKTNNKVKEIEQTSKFEINEHYGNLFQAYSVSNPVLNEEAEILTFDFEGDISNYVVFEGSQIIVFVDNGLNTSNLNTLFSLSSGAQLFVNGVLQDSGNTSIDFSDTNEFQVRSQDQSVLKTWVVNVSNAIEDVTFYKKDAVCYADGAIKLLSSVHNSKATLTKDGATHATQLVQNGEVLFNNLEIGTYVVKVGGNIKEIVINLKE